MLCAEETMYRRLYPCPEEFLPERWLRGSELSKHNPAYAFLPFGHGIRKCIGHRISTMEMLIFITKIMQNYNVSYHHGPIEVYNKVVNVPVTPIRCRLERRK